MADSGAGIGDLHLARGDRRQAHGIAALVKRVMPPPLAQRARRAWEDLRDRASVFAFTLAVCARRVPRPRTLIFFGFAPGDDLLCTAVLRELRRRGERGLIMVSDHPALFAGNPDAAYVQPLWHRYDRYGSARTICRSLARLWRGRFVIPEYAPSIAPDRRRVPSRHIIAEMCARAGVTGDVSLRPYLTLSEEEKASARWASAHIVIQSTGLAARHPIRTKEWYPERFQGVVDALRAEVDFVQLGAASDPPLRGARDLRGATSKREAASILYHARLFVGLVGLLMHLARAVECPGVIVFGGREAPWQSGYICNHNLYSAVPAAPCWRSNECECARACMDRITVSDVVAAIRGMLAKPRGPLAVATVEVHAQRAL